MSKQKNTNLCPLPILKLFFWIMVNYSALIHLPSAIKRRASDLCPSFYCPGAEGQVGVESFVGGGRGINLLSSFHLIFSPLSAPFGLSPVLFSALPASLVSSSLTLRETASDTFVEATVLTESVENITPNFVL